MASRGHVRRVAASAVDVVLCTVCWSSLQLTSQPIVSIFNNNNDNNSHCCGYHEQVILGNTLNPFTVIRNHIFLLHLNFLLWRASTRLFRCRSCKSGYLDRPAAGHLVTIGDPGLLLFGGPIFTEPILIF